MGRRFTERAGEPALSVVVSESRSPGSAWAFYIDDYRRGAS
jgi:hypothetical protein